MAVGNVALGLAVFLVLGNGVARGGAHLGLVVEHHAELVEGFAEAQQQAGDALLGLGGAGLLFLQQFLARGQLGACGLVLIVSRLEFAHRGAACLDHQAVDGGRGILGGGLAFGRCARGGGEVNDLGLQLGEALAVEDEAANEVGSGHAHHAGGNADGLVAQVERGPGEPGEAQAAEQREHDEVGRAGAYLGFHVALGGKHVAAIDDLLFRHAASQFVFAGQLGKVFVRAEDGEAGGDGIAAGLHVLVDLGEALAFLVARSDSHVERRCQLGDPLDRVRRDAAEVGQFADGGLAVLQALLGGLEGLLEFEHPVVAALDDGGEIGEALVHLGGQFAEGLQPGGHEGLLFLLDALLVLRQLRAAAVQLVAPGTHAHLGLLHLRLLLERKLAGAAEGEAVAGYIVQLLAQITHAQGAGMAQVLLGGGQFLPVAALFNLALHGLFHQRLQHAGLLEGIAARGVGVGAFFYQAHQLHAQGGQGLALGTRLADGVDAVLQQVHGPIARMLFRPSVGEGLQLVAYLVQRVTVA